VIYAQFQHPSAFRWQSRLARIPRWAWIAFFLPLLLLIALVVIAGLILMAVVLIVRTIFGLFSRLLLPRPRSHSHGEIVVHSVRVIDP
jgi:hypothetical protein